VFLKLKSFDPTKDTPVEMLHVVLLGVTKYVFHIAAGNFLSAYMIKALENGFRSYDSKAFNRKLHSSMRLYQSFLGRDFKIMVQVLPLVLNDALGSVAFASFRDNENGQVIIQAMFNCFEKLGEVSSLLYLEKIRNNFDSYLLLLQSTVSELVDAIDTLHHTRINSSASQRRNINTSTMENSLDEPHIDFETPFGRDRGSLCNRLKIHLLVHLAEDVHRFAGGPHTESEKGEQFNKYIRDNLFHTNRQNTSRDVAVRFAEETMLRHLAQDGVWGLNGQQRCGVSVRGFAQSSLYKQHFNGSDRDRADNTLVFVTSSLLVFLLYSRTEVFQIILLSRQ
jgi:hypothetical protein